VIDIRSLSPVPDARHRSPGTGGLGDGLRRGENIAIEGGEWRFGEPPPDAQAVPLEAHESLGSSKTAAEVPLTGLSSALTAAEAIRTRQFRLLWLVLCLNVSAGIGVIGMASPMLQEMFGGRLVAGVPPARAYDRTMFMLAGLLAAGLLANLAIRSLQAARNQTKTASDIAARSIGNATTGETATSGPIVITFWLLVAVPLGWGTWQTLREVSALFW